VSHTIPWPAVYSRNIFVAVFPFEERSVVFGASGPVEPDVVRFAPADPNGVAVSDLIDRTKLAGCGKSRDFGKTVMKRARNGNPGLIKSTGYEGAKGDESGWKHHRPTFSAAC
jgi:hypothetical protein